VIVKRFKETETSVSLEERWKKFNEAAHKAGGDANCNYFSLTLLSHVALRDGMLRPVLGNIVPHDFGLPDGVEFVHRRDSHQPVRFLNQIALHGWNNAQGLPKPDTVALARGAVLLFQCDNENKSQVFSRLAQIETEGIGERRSEGFGRIAVCYPIHYQFGG
jgi:CRISPR-associated protein Csx10